MKNDFLNGWMCGLLCGLFLSFLGPANADPVSGTPTVTRSYTATIESLTSADDGTITLGVSPRGTRVVRVGCSYVSPTGAPAAVLPTIQLSDGGGNVMTHSAPTCVTGNTMITFVAVTAGNNLVQGERLTFNVTNVPDGFHTVTITAQFVEL